MKDKDLKNFYTKRLINAIEKQANALERNRQNELLNVIDLKNNLANLNERVTEMLKSKDRVDISLQEYLQLTTTLKEQKEKLSYLNTIFTTMKLDKYINVLNPYNVKIAEYTDPTSLRKYIQVNMEIDQLKLQRENEKHNDPLAIYYKK